ncbi:MAG: Zn-ribbon domain-containing OB-fold protein [Lautropia sp.]
MSAESAIPMRPEFAGHFTGLESRSIRFPKCSDCGRLHWYPLPKCPHCGSEALQWHAVGGRGSVWSWTVVRHAYGPELRDRLPYAVALVTFDDAPGIRLLTNLVDTDPAALAIGMAVDPVYRRDDAGLPRVAFRPATGAR